MRSVKEIRDMIGEEFDLREVPDTPWLIEIGLRLSAVTQLHTGTILTNSPSDFDVIIHERDRIFIQFKRKLSEILWKYLGETAIKG